ncbi:unnamed protein product [Pylaiella littoralis]
MFCTTCHEAWPCKNPPPGGGSVYQCGRSVSSSFVLLAKFSAGNDMMPGPVPEALRGLTMSQEIVISMAFPVCKVFRLAGGAHGYKGHVMSIGQNIGRFVRTLPWLPNSDEMPVIIIQPPSGGSWAGREFKVSLTRVERALNYLILHCPPYRDVVGIDMERVRQELEALQREGDGDEVDVMGLDEDEDEDGDGGVRDPEDAANSRARPQRQPRESFIPMPGSDEGEAEILRRHLEEMTGYRGSGGSDPPTMRYPEREEALRETTPWLRSMCFPALFPEGVGDPSGPRVREARDVDIITHLMKFVDRPEGEAHHYRFASHRTFRYWALDLRLRNGARGQCRVFLRNNPD